MQELTSEEINFVQEIAKGTTVEQAGELVGIKRRTAYKWKSQPHIRQAIEAAQKSQLRLVQHIETERVKAILPEISSLLEEAAPRMIEMLIELAETAPASVRLQAIKEVLRLSGVTENKIKVETTEHSFTVEKKGLSEEAANEIRRKILGIPD